MAGGVAEIEDLAAKLRVLRFELRMRIPRGVGVNLWYACEARALAAAGRVAGLRHFGGVDRGRRRLPVRTCGALRRRVRLGGCHRGTGR